MQSILICLYFGALHYTVSSSFPSPVNVVFSSVNLRNVLQWHPGNNTPANTVFAVQYAIYGDSVDGDKGKRVNWRVVRHCRDIPRNWCDLTNETWDLEEGYYARVRAIGRRAYSKWVLTQRRFDPILDTTLGPPMVSVEIQYNTAIITMKGPMRYQPNNITPEIPMETFYHKMAYNLSIHNIHKGQMRHILMDSSTYKYRMMEYATEYCFSARRRLFSMPIWCEPSEWHCITTPPDPLIDQLRRVIIGIVVPSLCICLLVVGGYYLFYYLKGKGKGSPNILADIAAFHAYPPTLSSEKTNFISTSVMKDYPTLGTYSHAQQSTCSQQQQHIPDSPPAYGLHRASSELEEPWENEATDYGFVQPALQASVGGEGENGEVNEDVLQSGYEMGEWTTGVAAQLNTSHSQTSADRHTDGTAWIEMQPLSQADPVFFPRSQASLTALQGDVAGEQGAQECLGINIKKAPTTGFFQLLLDLQANRKKEMTKVMEGAMEKEMVENANEIVHAGVEKSTECERAPLLSSYASQHIPNPHVDQPDYLPDDYGVLRLATEQEMEKEEEKEEEGTDEGTISFGAAAQLNTSHSQTSADRHTDGTAWIEIQPLSQADPVFFPRSQASLTALRGDVAGEQGAQECLGINIKKDPTTGFFQLLLDLQANREKEMMKVTEGAMEKEMVGEVDKITHAAVVKNAECERAPLLSSCAAQHIPNPHVDEPDCLPDDYGVLRLATEQEMEKEEEEEEEGTDEGTISSERDPETGNPTPAQIEESKRGGGLKDVAQGEKDRGEEEETQPIESRLRLDNVCLRQGSEQMQEAESKVDDIIAKWDLVISLDQ